MITMTMVLWQKSDGHGALTKFGQDLIPCFIHPPFSHQIKTLPRACFQLNQVCQNLLIMYHDHDDQNENTLLYRMTKNHNDDGDKCLMMMMMARQGPHLPPGSDYDVCAKAIGSK